MMRVVSFCLVLFAMAAPAAAADLPAALVDAYLTAQTALAADSVKELPAAAKTIDTEAASLGATAQPIVDGAKKLGSAKDLAAARTAFGELSDALVGYAEKSGSALPAGLRVAYCPMADKPWLQKGTDIKNPYYGSQMLTCGTIKK
jgi:Cu(I)/Ag(I) efflux system membrane fusion protein